MSSGYPLLPHMAVPNSLWARPAFDVLSISAFHITNVGHALEGLRKLSAIGSSTQAVFGVKGRMVQSTTSSKRSNWGSLWQPEGNPSHHQSRDEPPKSPAGRQGVQ